MNNLKKNMVLLCIVIMTMSMVMVPFTPTTLLNPQVATPQVATPEQVMMDLQRYLVERDVDGPLDSVLASYRDTGVIASDAVKNNDGAVGILITLEKNANLDGLENIIQFNWKADFGVAIIASAFVKGTENLVALENYEGVVTASADRLYKGANDDFNTVTDNLPIIEEPEAWATVPWIGADDVWETLSYDGTGVKVATIDTGTDFSHPDLFGAIDIGSDGLPTSYDATGWGYVNTLYRVNVTNVANITAWYEGSSWNLLSYEKAGKYYINWSSMVDNPFYSNVVNGDGPRVNNQGGLANLDWWFDGYLDAWWGTAHPYPNVANLTEFYYNVIRQDLEIPEPSKCMGGATSQGVTYLTAGYAFQQRNDPYTKVFAPIITINKTIAIVDWNTTRAHTEFWMDAIRLSRYTGIDFNVTANRDYYEGLGDWSFVDDLAAGKYYTKDGNPEHLIMYEDYPDGLRFSLGTLAHCWEMNIFGFGMINGIRTGDGRGMGIMYDGDSHGTFVSGQIAGRGVLTYPVGPGGSSVALPGVAPDSTIAGVMTVGMVSEFNSFLYAAGFDYSGGWWSWNNESVHQMDISSNSWGWVAPQYYELWGRYSLVYAALATPGFFGPQYPGTIQVFSAGNSGPGYATGGPPTVPQIISVGATTSYHTFESAYGDNQGFDQIADFSSRGPMTLGYSKPDILAPGRNNYGLVPDYGKLFGTRNNYAVYAGTSMACPLVAGVAALMLDADPTLAPDEVKTIMMSTAVDLGLDGLTQGAGRVDAFAAVNYIENNVGYVFSTMDSSYNWATAVDEGWAYDMYAYTRDALINNSAIALGHAPYFADYNLFFGLVNEGDSVTMSINSDGNWAFGDLTWSDRHYVEDTSTTFGFTTGTYYDPSTKANRGTWIDLATGLGGNYGNFQSATYATISIAGDIDAFDDVTGGGIPLSAFVFDWTDTDPPNGVPDYYNGTYGNELTRIAYGAYSANVIKIDLSTPDGIGSLFPNAPIILVNGGTGNVLQVTVRTWSLTDDANIAAAIDSTIGGTNVTLTVGAGTDYGIHQGFIIADNGTYEWKMPYTYNVLSTYSANGTVFTPVSNVGDEVTPYEPGTLTAGWDASYAPGSSDHTAIIVNVTDSDVNYLCARLEWTNPGTDMDVDIVDMTGWAWATSADSVKDTDTTALAMAQIDGWTGLWMIYTTMNALNGSTIPEPFTIKVIGLKTIDEPTLTFRWNARDVPAQTVITDGGSAVGDHVYMNATWDNGVNPLIPEFGITSMEMKILYGNLVERTGPTVAASDPDAAFSGSPINPDDFAWETVAGIVTDDVVRVTVDFDGSDCDVMMWWSTVPMAERTYGNKIAVAPSMTSGAHPEAGSFVADRDGSIVVGIMDYAGDSSTYWLTVDTRVGLEPARAYHTRTFMIDTYYLLQNQTFGILVSSDTGSNFDYTGGISNVFIGNYFTPHVTVNAPVETSTNHFNITWSSTDRNVDDTTYYSVWLSNDGGDSYMLLQQNTTATSYQWNAVGWLDTDYIVRIRAYSLDFDTFVLEDTYDNGTLYEIYLCGVGNPPASYWPGDFADGFSASFAAGDVQVTPPVTTTTTTTTTTTITTGGIDPLLIGLVGGIGVGVVIILILFLIRKK
ncbi:MAG: S8 family serine peptidase [Candidatus Thorarchaeota archaeon]|nr:S8 family serine peptidase [Candidatus Thorarchaeota archaeon]